VILFFDIVCLIVVFTAEHREARSGFAGDRWVEQGDGSVFLDDEGEFRDQGEAEWIVIRRSLWGHNDMPFWRPTSGRLIGSPWSGRPQGVIGVF
jgi:hypothetical protein